MIEFIFMLTRNDQTVSDARDVYDTLRDTGLRYVGFKDIGLPPSEEGAVHVRLARRSPPVALTLSGGPGGGDCTGVTGLLGRDSAPEPAALRAATVNV